MDERFNVVIWDNDDYWRYVEQDMEAEDAVILARIIVDEAIRDGLISKVQIIDEDDFTNFLWERGKGIVFPRFGDHVSGGDEEGNP